MRFTSILFETMLKVLNVAEKNDAAKSIARIMSNGNSRMRDGFSKYNKIYDFEAQVFGQRCQMIMTSVSGHLLNYAFNIEYRNWNSCSPVELFDARIEKQCQDDNIKRTIEREARSCSKLIIWTDCDREGENIGFEIINICKAIKPNVDVYRAIFSEITNHSINRALNNLARPNGLLNEAVEARQELDLRIGAAFTRFQTLRIRRTFPNAIPESVVSYGSCQFPTLGFVVERFKQREQFKSEPFWKIIVQHKLDDKEVEFSWDRGQLFDYAACFAFYDLIISNPVALVTEVKTKPKSKWRPVALDTIELEKLSSRKLKINAKETMRIAEKLYTQGFISYPRTETNIFPKEFNLHSLIEQQANDNNWGEFAQQILQNGPSPRNGNKSDQAHPPIHPIKYANNLNGNEQRVYEFIVRHFLACCSQDAKGLETTISIDVNKEKFHASGLMITERNYLEVYPYEKWSDKEIPIYSQGQTFQPTNIELKDGKTEPPQLLAEADLIALMEKHGIGTDATHADHIETIKERSYVSLNPQNRFVPGELGLGLVEAYDLMGYAMSKPHLRASLEDDLKAITEGRKTKAGVLQEQINAYKNVFIDAVQNVQKLDEAISKYFGQPQTQNLQDITNNEVFVVNEPIMECSCESQMILRTRKEGKGFFIGCRSYPTCRNAIWFPSSVIDLSVTNEYCQQCLPKRVKKLRFKFERGSMTPTIPLDYTSCIVCDTELKQCLQINIKPSSTNTTNQSSDSGYRSFIGSTNQTANSATQQRYNTSVTNSTNSFSTASFNRHSNTAFTNTQNNINRQTNFNQNSLINDSNSDDNPIMCNCNANAQLLTVRKDGPNQGRQFYSCSTKSCQFFLWADIKNDQNNSNTNTNTNTNTNYHNNFSTQNSLNRSPNATCSCGSQLKTCTVQKEGPNKGRKFLKCNSCNYFGWDDDSNRGNNNENNSFTNYSRPNNNNNNNNNNSFRSSKKPDNNKSQYRKNRDNSDDTTTKKRKCGVCGMEGHNRKNCPNLN